MPWPKRGATHYHAQLGPLRQRSCNQRVGCLLGECTLYTAIKTRIMFQGAWKGLEPKATSSPLQVIKHQIDILVLVHEEATILGMKLALRCRHNQGARSQLLLKRGYSV